MLFEALNAQLHEKITSAFFLFQKKNVSFPFVFHIRNAAILVWNNMREGESFLAKL